MALLWGFWEIAEEFAYAPEVRHFDLVVSSAIVSLRSPWLTATMRAITATGGTMFVAAVTIGLVIGHLSRRRTRAAVSSAVFVAGGSLLVAVAKGRFARPRPLAAEALVALPASLSFPSGHAMASLCLGAAVAFVVLNSEAVAHWKVLLTLTACVIYPLAVGASRVYLGVHYPSDVIASWLLGGSLIAPAWGLAVSMEGAGEATSLPRS